MEPHRQRLISIPVFAPPFLDAGRTQDEGWTKSCVEGSRAVVLKGRGKNKNGVGGDWRGS
jgi:hypothetical protein